MDFNSFIKTEQQQQYISGMRPVLNRRALFSDTTEDYVTPCEPLPFGRVTISFRSAKNNIDQVYIVSNVERELMSKIGSDDSFDYYQVECQLENEKFIYYFEILAGKIVCYYDKRGVCKDTNTMFNFFIIPGFTTPNWAKGAVMYQIFVDRFYNGDRSNDVLTREYSYIGDHTIGVDEWNKYPNQIGVREFYGGDLQGVLDKLDYIQDLGVEVIYFNPLFVSPSNHKYDIQDYDYIDPHFGRIVNDTGNLLEPGQKENRYASKYINRVTNKENLEASNQLFIEVVEEIHKRGMKVILDGVFNHCGSFNKWLDKERIYEYADGYNKGAFITGDSPYVNYFDFTKKDQWPYNANYDGWWGHDTLPKLNFEGSKELYDYILYIGKKWVSPPFNVDGWRLDVAADLAHSPEANHQFWKDFRKSVKEANPNAIILAEHYGKPESWLQGDEWDTVMNYDAFMEPITWFLTGMEKHSDDYREDLLGNADSFWKAMSNHAACFTRPSFDTAMNELSNHDHSRFLTRTNRKVGRTNTLGARAAEENINKAVMREAVVMQMTWPGAPTIYYGDEAGVCGFTDPDNRRTYPWGHEDQEMIAFHKEMIRIHKENPEIRKGSFKYLDADYNIVGYGRFNKIESTIILVNNNDYEINREVKVHELGVPMQATLERLILTNESGFDVNPCSYPVVSGKVLITLPKTSSIVLKYKKDIIKKPDKNFLQFS
ncbi:MAG TPA: glycoside hydrolase family 13 protein [Lachnospiraceae bacterium]|nr:glycoside hydrolase family 13 protein [Lachnospiraceae bacterium]